MADGVLCPACISSEEDARNSAALPSSGEEMPKPYGWGKVGVLLILGSFRLLSHDTTLESPESPASSLLLFVFNMALGILHPQAEPADSPANGDNRCSDGAQCHRLKNIYFTPPKTLCPILCPLCIKYRRTW